jgi:electron transfer flavoprotein alpha subunit
VAAVALGTATTDKLTELGNYGAAKVFCVNNNMYDAFDAQAHAHAVAQIAQNVGASVVIIANTYTGKSIAPRVAVRLSAALAPDAISLPTLAADGSMVLQRTVFSNKGYAQINLNTPVKVIALSPNSYTATQTTATATVENIEIAAPSFITKSIAKNIATGKIPLTEAEVVVSGGRGLKAPENWHLIENLAQALGAATACSKPVSDMDWRPHSEHVGQTGITIKPNLYIATGISGAIQHLAGVSGSKVIVAINTDKDAPFFKVADYGIVGDAFEILPQLTAAVQKYKAANA